MKILCFNNMHNLNALTKYVVHDLENKDCVC